MSGYVTPGRHLCVCACVFGCSYIYAPVGEGIYMSRDMGDSWAVLAFTWGNQDFYYVNKLRVSPSDPNILYAGTSRSRSYTHTHTNINMHARTHLLDSTWANQDFYGANKLRVSPSDPTYSTQVRATHTHTHIHLLWAANICAYHPQIQPSCAQLSIKSSHTHTQTHIICNCILTLSLLLSLSLVPTATRTGLHKSMNGGQTWGNTFGEKNLKF